MQAGRPWNQELMQPVAAIILAAGRASRLGHVKAYLRLEGRTLIERVARAARDGGATHVVTVVGGEATSDAPGAHLASAEVVRGLLGASADVVIGRPELAPLDSLRAGLARVPAGAAVLVWPVDHPFADAALVAALARALGDDEEGVAVPTGARGPGHPVLFGRALVDALAHGALPGGARDLVTRPGARIYSVPSRDPRVADDVDTLSDAARLGVELPLLRGSKR